MNGDDASVLRQTLIREGVALAIMAGLLWYMGPGKILIGGMVHRARTMMGARETEIDVQTARFRSEVSRWEHEQAAQADNRPGRGGGCGCG